MEKNDENITINGPDNLKFGIDEFEKLSSDKNKNITKILKKEIMNEA